MKYSIIDDSTNNDVLYPTINGVRMRHGYDPSQVVVTAQRPTISSLFGDAPGQLKLIPRSEWDARYDEQEQLQSSLQHLRMRGDHGKMIDALDQNGQGYCWNYSVMMAMMMLRAVANLPCVRLSGHANACLIKGYRDEGGWGALAADYAMKYGAPSTDFWKEKSMSKSNDTPAMRENAMSHRVTEDWSDQSLSPYDRNFTEEQAATLCFNNIPYIHDSNDWGHSICILRWVRTEKGVWGPLCLNSWTNGWEDNGMAVLLGRRRLPDGAIALRVTGASSN